MAQLQKCHFWPSSVGLFALKCATVAHRLRHFRCAKVALFGGKHLQSAQKSAIFGLQGDRFRAVFVPDGEKTLRKQVAQNRDRTAGLHTPLCLGSSANGCWARSVPKTSFAEKDLSSGNNMNPPKCFGKLFLRQIILQTNRKQHWLDFNL